MEGAAFHTDAAAGAVGRILGQGLIVLNRKLISDLRQIKILIDSANIDPGGAGLTVIAVNTVNRRSVQRCFCGFREAKPNCL